LDLLQQLCVYSGRVTGAKSRGARLGYGSRSDPRRGTIFRRFRNKQISRSEALSEVWQWRRQRDAG
jgi:hypothetical protein